MASFSEWTEVISGIPQQWWIQGRGGGGGGRPYWLIFFQKGDFSVFKAYSPLCVPTRMFR